MPKNLTPNHFEYAGVYVEGERSIFRFSKPHQASFMSGMLVPLGDPIPVFPGVKLDLQIEANIRSNTLVVPPLDGMYIDFISVWVPHRIVWNHMPQFLGENDVTAWTQSNSYTYPHVTLGDINNGEGNLPDILDASEDYSVVVSNLFLSSHYGLFYGITFLNGSEEGYPGKSLNINVLAYRGYYAIWNYLFRDINYQRPVLFSKGDTGDYGEFGYLLRDYDIAEAESISDFINLFSGQDVDTALLMPVNKLHDAFTSVLPQPQFGDAVTLPLAGNAPVIGVATMHTMGTNGILLGSNATTKVSAASPLGILNSAAGKVGYGSAESEGSYGVAVGASNLVADLGQATSANINALRTSVMYQRYLEAIARAGASRVPEYYATIYGVKNSDARKDYPELISRSRYMLNAQQVVATADASGTGWSSHLGDVGAYSHTALRNIPCCEKDFTEFGYLHILYCVRTGNRYSQMVQPHFLKIELLDEYNSFFDHIGDVAVPGLTVNVLAESAANFGYQEAWWSERTQLGMAVGALNKGYGSLKWWVLGEKFSRNLKTCTPTYLTFDPAIFNDVMASAYFVYPQFIIDSLIHGKKIARMSQHSIPGITGRI